MFYSHVKDGVTEAQRNRYKETETHRRHIDREQEEVPLDYDRTDEVRGSFPALNLLRLGILESVSPITFYILVKYMSL